MTNQYQDNVSRTFGHFITDTDINEEISDLLIKSFREVMVEPDEEISSKQLLMNRGKYSVNNDVVAFVDWSGNIFAGRATYETIVMLKELGAMSGNFYVPHSNDGGLWLDKNLQAKIDYMKSRENKINLDYSI